MIIDLATRPATRTVARSGWGVLVTVGVVLAVHGLGRYALAATPGGRATGILLAGVGLLTLMAAFDGFRHGSRWAWNATWVAVAVLTALGAHILLGGMLDVGGGHLLLAVAALVGQLLAAADRVPPVTARPSIGQQLRTAYPVGLAYAAGTIGIVANLQLLGFYVVEFGLPQSGGQLGSANDLTNAPYTALMIPVAVALGRYLPPGRASLVTQLTGIVAMAAFAVAGPLLVYGVIDFQTQLTIGSVTAAMMFTWLFLVSRMLGRSPSWSGPARLGRVLGTMFVAALLIIGASLLLPWMSLPQQIVAGVGALLGGLGYLAIPAWFLLVGNRLTAPATSSAAEEPVDSAS